jgi:peptide chain release factor 1
MPDVSTVSAPPALLRKLEELSRRYEELQNSLNDPAFVSNPQMMIPATKESGQILPVVERYREYQSAARQVEELTEMSANRADPDMAALAEEELPAAIEKANRLVEDLKDHYIAAEDNAVDSFFLEIRAGTGGEEAALFGRDLFEMYRRYCERHRWQFIVSDLSTSERGGFKEVIVNVKGDGAYRHLQYEGGGHRVQRVPETEAQGRIHTSAATVAVLPELQDVEIHVDPKDVEEFGCRGGGPGGQNVNKVETGWYIKYKPTGLSFKMTEHKSQTQNKERAWALLRSTLHQAEQAKQHAAQMGARKAMMGSGDRSARVRTYNFPQNRCTDHRLGGEGGGEKNFNLDQVLAGDMSDLVGALIEMDKRQRLENL